MKKFLPTIFIVALAAGLFLYIRLGERKHTPKDKNDGGFVEVLNIPEEDIRRVEITEYNPEDGRVEAGENIYTPHKRTVLARKGGAWRVLEPGPPRANQNAVENMIFSLASFQAESLVEKNPKDVRKFGLDKPGLTIKIILKNKKSREVLFGDLNQITQGYYVRMKGKSPVYIVPASYMKPFLYPSDLIDKSLVDLSWDDVLDEVTVASGDTTVTCVRKGEDWHYKDGGEPGACNEAKEKLIESLTSTQFMEYVAEPGDLASLGLAPSSATILIKKAKNKKIELAVGNRILDMVFVENKQRKEVYKVVVTFDAGVREFLKAAKKVGKSE